MAEKTMKRLVGGIEYTLTVKKVKNINLRISRDGKVSVSANKRVPLKEIDRFVLSNRNKIENFVKQAEIRSRKILLPNSISEGAEFYFLGEKKRISITQNKTYLSGDILYVSGKKAFEKWLEEQAKEIFLRYVDIVYGQFEKYRVPYPLIVVKTLKSQWGNCRPATGKITLNLYLLAAPPECIYYVVVHEFSHFVHPNHSKYFWAVVEQFVPDCKAKRKLLREYSAM